MTKVVSYSKSILQHEYEVNNLISNLFIYIFNLFRNQKDSIEETKLTLTEISILSMFRNLSEDEIKGLIKLINIINSGAYKYLNKYFIIDVSIPESLKSDRNHIVCDFKTLRDPDVFRKINKKLSKEKSFLISLDKDLDLVNVKEVFNDNIHNLNFILNEIVLDLQPDNFGRDFETFNNTLDEVLNKLKSNFLSRFGNSL